MSLHALSIIRRQLQQGDEDAMTIAENYTVDDDPLPEGVDFSEGGWATDYATAIIAFLFFITSVVPNTKHSHYNNDQFGHFKYLFLGTAIAHFGGAKAHRYFYNRAADGTGQVGFYISMMIGYTGNCLRYGFGWGLGSPWTYISIINVGFLWGAGLYAMIDMDKTKDPFDSVDSYNDNDELYLPDTLFMGAEVIASVCELLTSIFFLCKYRNNIYVLFTCLINAGGWIAVYGAYLISVSNIQQFGKSPGFCLSLHGILEFHVTSRSLTSPISCPFLVSYRL